MKKKINIKKIYNDAKKIIPGGTQLFSKRAELYHPDSWPTYYSEAKGINIKSLDNKNYKDFCNMSVGASILGYCDDYVDKKVIAQVISAAENFPHKYAHIFNEITKLSSSNKVPVLGITGTGGAGKSSLVDELVRRFLVDFESKQIAIVSVDPSKRKTGGALLGDRIRMNSINNDRVYMRSLATRQSNLALSKHVSEALQVLKAANFDLIILKTLFKAFSVF